jgi:hypothetical protein
MDLGFDLKYPQPGAANHADAGDFRRVPDWHELSARLVASWAARRAMADDPARTAARRGNFDPVSAKALAGYEHASHAVNRAALGNRKPDGGIAVCLAGISQSGDRG